jgi:PTS system mannose-specific IIC component
MTEVSALVVVGLLAWGTVVGLDLVSGPQVLLSRPLVGGAVAGLLLGQLEVGLQIGAVLELFALDVLPVGAARYPDYGPATVGAVAFGCWAGGATTDVIGLSVGCGLLLALVGGLSMELMRRANARSIQARTVRLAAGDPMTIRALHYAGLARDVGRSVVMTALGLIVAALAPAAPADPAFRTALTIVAVGAGAAAALHGAMLIAGRGTRLAWLGAGVAMGLAVAALR